MPTRAKCFASSIVLLAIFGFSSASARADVLVSTTGASSGLFNNNPEGVSWTVGDAYTNVSISALISSDSISQQGAGTFYLTNSVGPGTTAANVVAEATLSNLAYEPNADTSLFSGLSLGAGTYYLISSSSAGSGGVAWEGLTSPTTVTASDVSFGGEFFSFDTNAFAPADSFSALVGPNFGLDVTGTPAASAVTPEPGSLVLLGTGLLGLVGAARRRLS